MAQIILTLEELGKLHRRALKAAQKETWNNGKVIIERNDKVLSAKLQSASSDANDTVIYLG